MTTDVVVEPLVRRVPALLAPGARALDCGCGRGQHAVVLAHAGITVDAIDRPGAAFDGLADLAAEAGIPIRCVTADLRTYEPEPAAYDAVLAIKILHLFRPPVAERLLASLRDAVVPGGIAVVTSFTIDPATAAAMAPGGSVPGTFLDADQLRARFTGWDIVAEGLEDMDLRQVGPDGKPIRVRKAGVIARRPA
jgi:SAM-dependent methyltransferase